MLFNVRKIIKKVLALRITYVLIYQSMRFSPT